MEQEESSEAVEPVEDGGLGSGQGSDTPDYSLANGFLKDVPEEHRELLEPYVKKWDAGVTRRFTDLHSKYAPYEQLGVEDPTVLEEALQVYRVLDENPRQVYEALRTQFEEALEEAEDESEDGTFQGLPPEVAKQLTEQREVLELLAEFMLGQQQSEKEAQEEKELDDYLDLLKQEYGDFDEDYVLAKMYRGMDGGKAVEAWKAAVQQYGGTPPRPKAKVLSGAGALPVEAQNVAKIPRTDVKNMVAKLLADAASEG